MPGNWRCRKGFVGIRRRLLPLATTFGLLALAELVTRIGVLDSRYLPPPSEILVALGGKLAEASIAGDVEATLAGWSLGLAIATALALPLGVLVGSSEALYRAFRSPIELVRPVPSVALVPLVVLTLGTEMDAKVFLIAFAVVWPLLIQTAYGVRDLDPQLVETARCLGLGRGSRLLRVTMPGALPYIATGLRLASSLALVVAVTAELVIGAHGLGKSIALAEEGGAVKNMYALIVVAGALGFALNAVFAWVEAKLLRWHVSSRGSL